MNKKTRSGREDFLVLEPVFYRRVPLVIPLGFSASGGACTPESVTAPKMTLGSKQRSTFSYPAGSEPIVSKIKKECNSFFKKK